MPPSSQYIAFGAVADVIGKRLQQKKDQAHQEELAHQQMVNQGLSEGLKAGIFKDPQAVFETMVNGGKPMKAGKDGKSQSKIPAPLQSLIDTIHKSAPAPQQVPQLKTEDELNASDAKATEAKAGAATTGQLTARMGIANRLITQGMDPDTAYERAGLPAHARVNAPKVIPGALSSDDVLKTDPKATMLDGSPVQPGTSVQRVEVQGPNGPEFKYIVGPKPGSGKAPSTILKDMSPGLRNFVEPRLAAAGLIPSEATDDDIKKVLPAASKAALNKEYEGALNASELGELRRLNLNLAKQSQQGGGKGPNGEELPEVMVDAQGRPDPAAQREFLQDFPQDTRAIIKGLADYTINPTTISNRTTSAKGGGITRAQAIGWVKQYDPTYDDKQYPVRAKLEQDWSSGKTRDAMVAVNTAARHLGNLAKATKDLAPFTYGNEYVNKAAYASKRQYNAKVRDAIRRFETARDAVAEELRKVYAGTGGGALEEVKKWQENASTTAPTDEKLAFQNEAVKLMIGRINSATEKYKSVMGRGPKTGMGISPEALKILNDLGLDTSDLNEAVKPGDPEGIR